MKRIASAFWSPAGVACLILVVAVGVDLLGADGDAFSLVRIGTQFSQGIEDGTEGYDGQFVYYIARQPSPEAVEGYLDVPAYRYQRILFPLAGNLLSMGEENLIPWTLLFLGIAAQTIGTWFVSKMLASWGVNRWYALTYGLWPGLVVSVRVMLPEPLAFAFVAGAIFSYSMGGKRLSWLLYSLALFTKEVAIFFVVGHILFEVVNQRWRQAFGLLSFTLIPFAIFQFWLLDTFGQMGVGSGGANATSFEFIPFMGLMRILPYSTSLFLVYLLLYLPSLVFPLIWGLFSGTRRLLASKANDVIDWILLANLLIIPFLPFSTYREPGGMLRFMTAAALALLLFAGKHKYSRALNYSPLWVALNLILIS